jgi:hypothetical protein
VSFQQSRIKVLVVLAGLSQLLLFSKVPMLSTKKLLLHLSLSNSSLIVFPKLLIIAMDAVVAGLLVPSITLLPRVLQLKLLILTKEFQVLASPLLLFSSPLLKKLLLLLMPVSLLLLMFSLFRLPLMRLLGVTIALVPSLTALPRLVPLITPFSLLVMMPMEIGSSETLGVLLGEIKDILPLLLVTLAVSTTMVLLLLLDICFVYK